MNFNEYLNFRAKNSKKNTFLRLLASLAQKSHFAVVCVFWGRIYTLHNIHVEFPLS